MRNYARRCKRLSAVGQPCRNAKRQPTSPRQARRLLFVAGPRDARLRALEQQMRRGVRDAVNRSSRKPFHWAGLRGYQQLEALAQELQQGLTGAHPSPYLQQLLVPIERALTNNRTLARDVGEAFGWVRRIVACLRYGDLPDAPATAAQVAQEMETLLGEFQPDLKRQAAQTALASTWRRLWRTWGPELLHCYDIPGLPADNLQLEAFFGRLRRHQRRISGRKSTAELRSFGHCQALFQAETEADLLGQLREVKLADYQAARRRLAEAEAPRQFLHRLHRDPAKTVRQLLHDYAARQIELAQSTAACVHNT